MTAIFAAIDFEASFMSIEKYSRIVWLVQDHQAKTFLQASPGHVIGSSLWSASGDYSALDNRALSIPFLLNSFALIFDFC